MTVQELYASIDGDYSEAIGRLRSEKLISRFVVKFLDDSSCGELIDAWARGDEEATFKAAHTAKGVCANLSLTKLADLSSSITEALRPGNESLRAQTDVDALVAQFKDAYDNAVTLITRYANEQ